MRTYDHVKVGFPGLRGRASPLARDNGKKSERGRKRTIAATLQQRTRSSGKECGPPTKTS